MGPLGFDHVQGQRARGVGRPEVQRAAGVPGDPDAGPGQSRRGGQRVATHRPPVRRPPAAVVDELGRAQVRPVPADETRLAHVALRGPAAVRDRYHGRGGHVQQHSGHAAPVPATGQRPHRGGRRTEGQPDRQDVAAHVVAPDPTGQRHSTQR